MTTHFPKPRRCVIASGKDNAKSEKQTTKNNCKNRDDSAQHFWCDLPLTMSGRQRLAAQDNNVNRPERPAGGGPLDGRVTRHFVTTELAGFPVASSSIQTEDFSFVSSPFTKYTPFD